MEKEEFIVDRIEGNNIIIETSKGIITVLKSELTKLPREGDVLIMVNNKFEIDSNATATRKEKINKLMKGMWAE